MNLSSGARKRKRPSGGDEIGMTSTSALLKGQGSTQFSDRWPEMRPVVLKLLNQEQVTRDEWQNLFWCVCPWGVTEYLITVASEVERLRMRLAN